MTDNLALWNDNLALWNAVEKTPASHTKKITGKSYQGTSPKPHYLVHKATETFGPCGIGWGFTIADERIEEGAGGERMHIARVKVWYEWGGKRGEVEHVGGTQFSGVRASGKPFTDEDAPKKSITDALVKALSMIGFAGDIFMGRYDDSKYVADLQSEERQAANACEASLSKKDARPLYSELEKSMRACTTKAELSDWYKRDETKEARAKLPADWQNTLKQAAADFGRGLPEGHAEDDTVSEIKNQFPGARVTGDRPLSTLEAG